MPGDSQDWSNLLAPFLVSVLFAAALVTLALVAVAAWAREAVEPDE